MDTDTLRRRLASRGPEESRGRREGRALVPQLHRTGEDTPAGDSWSTPRNRWASSSTGGSGSDGHVAWCARMLERDDVREAVDD